MRDGIICCGRVPRFDASAAKALKKLDRPVQQRIIRFLRERIAPSETPRILGKALRGSQGEFWRYRVGDYRLLCRVEDDILVVLVVSVGHRREIYR
jgi:mRNA interferase RelE/StbE